jgi:LCP family protein required for cell wall assembly
LYRRKRVIVPLVTLIALVMLASAGAWYVNGQFAALKQLSTPPPAVSGERLGGDQSLVIDTGPAQEALLNAEAARAASKTEADDAEAGMPTQRVSGSAQDEDVEWNLSEEPTSQVLVTAGTSGLASGGGAIPSSGAFMVAGGSAPASAPPTLHEPIARDSYAVLAMGVDARPGEPIDIEVRPDSLAVVYLDGSDGSCRMLSIPRDTRVELPGYGQSKINHALAVGGVPYEALVVENLLGIELPHYGLIDFGGIEGLVDGVGGITVENDAAFSTDGHAFPQGTLELDGEEALAYSRFRDDERGDFGRQERQQQVVRALLSKGADLDAVTAIPQLLSTVEGHVRTDLGPNAMVDIAQAFRSTCTAETLETNRIEGTVAWAYDDLMGQELSFVLVDEAEVRAKVQWLIGGD